MSVLLPVKHRHLRRRRHARILQRTRSELPWFNRHLQRRSSTIAVTCDRLVLRRASVRLISRHCTTSTALANRMREIEAKPEPGVPGGPSKANTGGKRRPANGAYQQHDGRGG